MSDKFENVTVLKAANVYFDGKVTSRTLEFADGTKKTLGIMLPGDYDFNTTVAELMEVTAGEAEIKLPGADWKAYKGGSSFNVPADSNFLLKVTSPLDYVCSYL